MYICKVAPNDHHLLVHMPLCHSLPLHVNWTGKNRIQQKRWNGNFKIRLKRVTSNLGLSLTHSRSRSLFLICQCVLLLYFYFYLIYSEKRATILKLSYREAHVIRNKCLCSTVYKDLRPVNSHGNEFENKFLPRWSLRWLKPWLSPWLQPNQVSWARSTQVYHTWIPDTQKLWDNACSLFEAAKFQSNLCAAIDS